MVLKQNALPSRDREWKESNEREIYRRFQFLLLFFYWWVRDGVRVYSSSIYRRWILHPHFSPRRNSTGDFLFVCSNVLCFDKRTQSLPEHLRLLKKIKQPIPMKGNKYFYLVWLSFHTTKLDLYNRSAISTLQQTKKCRKFIEFYFLWALLSVTTDNWKYWRDIEKSMEIPSNR